MFYTHLYDYPQEVVTDFRTIYKMSVYDVGSTVPFEEGYWLLRGLFSMTESHLNAKIQGWVRPFRQEECAIIQDSNIQIALNTDKNKTPKLLPYPFEKPHAENKILGAAKMPLELAQKLYVNEYRDYTPEEAAVLNKAFIEQQEQTTVKG